MVHFISHKDWKSTIFELDFEYKHWIIQTYDFMIYKKEDWEILWDDWVYKIEWFNDLWIEYEQSVNFSYWNGMDLVMPYSMIRTSFGLIKEEVDIELDMEFELGSQVNLIHKNIKHEVYNWSLVTTPRIDHLIGSQKNEPMNGNVCTIQQYIMRTGRYSRFKYYGKKRFVIWESSIHFELPMNRYANELMNSN